MSLFQLSAFNDDEIDLITKSVTRWAERNHVDVLSEHGKLAMAQAIALVSSGVSSPEAIAGRLDQVCAPPVAPLSQGFPETDDGRSNPP